MKLLWAHHSFKFTAPECGKSSPHPPSCHRSIPPAPDFPVPSWSHFAALHIDYCVNKCHRRQRLLAKVIDFTCTSNSLGKKEGFCPCNFSFFSLQVPQADVSVQGQSQLETHVSPEEQNGHVLALEPAQVLLAAQHQGDLPLVTALHSKAFSNQ